MLHLWLRVTPAGPTAAPTAIGPPQLPAGCVLDERIAGQRFVACAWPPAQCGHACQTTASTLRLRCGPCFPGAALQADIAPQVEIDRADGRIRVHIPPTAVTPLFHSARASGLRIASDPRWLAAPQATLDERGLYQLLQFGALTAPYTLYREIARFPPGCTTILGPRGELLGRESSPTGVAAPGPPSRDPDAQADLIGALLDQRLRELCPDERPLILFSGGVDSGLLAARVARLGWRDALLVCWRPGAGDPQAELARAVADRLGLRLLLVGHGPEDWATSLAALPAAYPEPVGDFATIPSFHLTGRVLELAAGRRTVVDGSGADALFRTFPRLARWRRLYALPPLARSMAGGLYRLSRAWTGARRAGRWLGAARVSCRMPYVLASMIAENPLADLAYRAPRSVREEVHAALLDGIRLAFPAAAGELRSRALDLLHVVCALTVQKHAPLFLGSPLDLVHPFLHPSLVRVGFDLARMAGDGESKAPLKRLLARDVPAELVQRPKRGMTPEMRAVWARPEIGRFLERELLAADSPLADWLDAAILRTLVRRAVQGERLAHTTHNFLWTALFAMTWLRHNSRTGGAA